MSIKYLSPTEAVAIKGVPKPPKSRCLKKNPSKTTPNQTPTKPYTKPQCLSAIFITSVNLTCNFQMFPVSGTT